ncbi:MAG: HAMP domain-containing protein [Candidatus Margulisbacteria bacterium]|nr:HAMP domain-containing protein [Candidatus Margulisiibacteriota bacterium]
MISFSFNLAMVFSGFILFLLFYFGLLLIKNFNNFTILDEVSEDNPIIFFKQKLAIFLLSLAPIFVLDSLIRLMSSTNILPWNVYPFQGILAFAYIISMFSLINFALFNNGVTKKIFYSFLIVATPLSYFWIKTNILDGFFPVISNYFLVFVLKAIWVVIGLVVLVVIFNKRKQITEHEVVNMYMLSTTKYLLYFFLGNIIALGTTTMLMDYYFVFSSAISFGSLFFVFVMLTSDANSLDYYEKPYKIIKQKIVTRMMISITILIVVSLELVNYATIFIIQNELKYTKSQFFISIINDVNKEFYQTYDEVYASFSTYFKKYDSSQQLYYIGITLFNDMQHVKDLEKVLLLSKDSIPLLEVTKEHVNFNYTSPENITIYRPYVEAAAREGVRFSFNQPNNLMEITKVIKDQNDEIIYYVISFFKPIGLFTKINQHTFSPDGEILILNNKYEKLYSTETSESLKSELHKGNFFEIFGKNELTGLNILVRQPEKFAFSGIQKAQYNSFFFTIIAIIVFLIIAFAYMKTIEAPIKRLQKGAKAVGDGDLSYEIIIKEKNEFFELATAFNKMVGDLKNMQQEQIKQEQILSVSRMGVALNHEINNPVATITMGAQLSNKMLKNLEKECTGKLKSQLDTIQKTNEQIITESKRISKILKDIQEITNPIIEDYVDGTKMVRVKFD